MSFPGGAKGHICAIALRQRNASKVWTAYAAMAASTFSAGATRTSSISSQMDPREYHTLLPVKPKGTQASHLSRFTRAPTRFASFNEEYIEPLTGLGRHPLFWPPGCTQQTGRRPPAGNHAFDRTFDISYLVLTNHCNEQGEPMPPCSASAREFFFDLGSANYSGPVSRNQGSDKGPSLPLFMLLYEQRCITFDHVYAWESQQFSPIAWWKEVPVGVRSKLHFFNVPVGARPTDPSSVLALLNLIATPEDFVAMKVDVDGGPEVEIMETLANTPALAELVDEGFVVAMGRPEDVAMGIAMIEGLRFDHQCDIPVEAWHARELSKIALWKVQALKNVIVKDLAGFNGEASRFACRKEGCFHIKILMLLQSRFDIVFMVDADIIFLQNPGSLFEHPTLHSTSAGALAFPDFTSVNWCHDAWQASQETRRGAQRSLLASGKPMLLGRSSTLPALNEQISEHTPFGQGRSCHHQVCALPISISVFFSSPSAISIPYPRRCFAPSPPSCMTIHAAQESSLLLVNKSRAAGWLELLRQWVIDKDGMWRTVQSTSFGDKEAYWLAAEAVGAHMAFAPYCTARVGSPSNVSATRFAIGDSAPGEAPLRSGLLVHYHPFGIDPSTATLLAADLKHPIPFASNTDSHKDMSVSPPIPMGGSARKLCPAQESWGLPVPPGKQHRPFSSRERRLIAARDLRVAHLLPVASLLVRNGLCAVHGTSRVTSSNGAAECCMLGCNSSFGVCQQQCTVLSGTARHCVDSDATDCILPPAIRTHNQDVLSTPTVSALCVSGAGAEFLRRAVGNLFTQMYSALELVIVHDAWDAPAAAVAADALAWSRHRAVIHPTPSVVIAVNSNRNANLGDLRNLAVRRASGMYVMQWDDECALHRFWAHIYLQQGACTRDAMHALCQAFPFPHS